MKQPRVFEVAQKEISFFPKSESCEGRRGKYDPMLSVFENQWRGYLRNPPVVGVLEMVHKNLRLGPIAVGVTNRHQHALVFNAFPRTRIPHQPDAPIGDLTGIAAMCRRTGIWNKCFFKSHGRHLVAAHLLRSRRHPMKMQAAKTRPSKIQCDRRDAQSVPRGRRYDGQQLRQSSLQHDLHSCSRQHGERVRPSLGFPAAQRRLAV